jgi:aspartyl-tRNA(Asn)/glutamyl-tRNA(Gln) amidotransferase subunit B
MAARFQKDDGLALADAAMMTQSLAIARFYESARDAEAPAKLVANWVMGEMARRLNADNLEIGEAPVDATLLAALIKRIQDGTISNNAARQVFDALWTREKGTAGNVDVLIESLGLKQMNDSSELESIIDAVLAANQKSVDEFRAGKDKAFQALVGQAMKASKGKANPAQVNEMLKKKLGA